MAPLAHRPRAPLRALLLLTLVGLAATATACAGPRLATPTAATPSGAAAPLPTLTRRVGACEPCRLGCWPTAPCRTTYASAGLSFLPNVGASLGAGRVLARNAQAEWALEVEGAWQFLDDESFIDDGNPAADDWYQVRVGGRTALRPQARRRITLRYGAVWFQANGEPNIVDRSGDYWGVYGGVGFESDLTSRLTVGPELALLLATRDDEFAPEPVPQFSWRLTWWLDGRGGPALRRAPLGEVYVGASALLSPGLGGGLALGQVLARTDAATWSFEVHAGLQAADEELWFDGRGEYGQVRGGLKVAWQPCCRGHWTLRAGAAWLRSTVGSSFLDQPGDHVGVYGGVGYEFDLSPRLSMGPELALYAVAREKTTTFELVPQLTWHVILKL